MDIASRQGSADISATMSTREIKEGARGRDVSHSLHLITTDSSAGRTVQSM